MYKILSLDGGGCWSLLQIKALQEIYGKHAKGLDVLKNFDLIVANSGGSIAMAAMLTNLSLEDILNHYYLNAEVLQSVFVKLPPLSIKKLIRELIGVGPKFSAAKKLDGLRSILGNVGDIRIASLPDLFEGKKPQFVIVAFDYDTRREVFFRSDLNSKAQSSESVNSFQSVTLAQAIHAASNAPINFFDKPAQFIIGDAVRHFWDGAMGGYNNPVVAGLTEALCNGIKKEEIHILSVGTGSVKLPLKNLGIDAVSNKLFQPQKSSSLIRDIQEEGTCIIDDPPDAASFIAYVMLGNIPPAGAKNIVRLNPLIQPVLDGDSKWNYPTYDLPFDSPFKISENDFNRLVNLDMAAIKEEDVKLINKFGEAWIYGKVYNQAIRSNPDLSCDIGYQYFQEAKKAWHVMLQA